MRVSLPRLAVTAAMTAFVLLFLLYATKGEAWWRVGGARLELNGVAAQGVIYRSECGLLLVITENAGIYVVSWEPEAVWMPNDSAFFRTGILAWQRGPLGVRVNQDHPKTGWDPAVKYLGSELRFVGTENAQVRIVLK